MKFRVRTESGAETVEGEPFEASIAKCTFVFFVHEAVDGSGFLVVSEVESGVRILNIPKMTLLKKKGNRIEAARLALKKIVAGVGALKVRQEIELATKRRKD